jgi:hypothetical protein
MCGYCLQLPAQVAARLRIHWETEDNAERSAQAIPLFAPLSPKATKENDMTLLAALITNRDWLETRGI